MDLEGLRPRPLALLLPPLPPRMGGERLRERPLYDFAGGVTERDRERDKLRLLDLPRRGLGDLNAMVIDTMKKKSKGNACEFFYLKTRPGEHVIHVVDLWVR